jgi:hypothetical protein
MEYQIPEATLMGDTERISGDASSLRQREMQLVGVGAHPTNHHREMQQQFCHCSNTHPFHNQEDITFKYNKNTGPFIKQTVCNHPRKCSFIDFAG